MDRSNGIQATFLMPIVSIITAFSTFSVSMCAWCIDCKATLIEVDDWTLFDIFIPSDSRLELQTTDTVSLGMRQSFFYN